MAQRPRNPWRRVGTAFRLGQRGPAPANLDEQRLTLYLPAQLLDWGEDQAARAGATTVQLYCARLLSAALEAEQSRGAVAEVEARQGALAGFRAVTDDPDYLAEWVAVAHGPGLPPGQPERHPIQIVGGFPAPSPEPSDASASPDADADAVDRPRRGPSPAAQAILRHAAMTPDAPEGFLAVLRRGEPLPDHHASELLQALQALEVEHRAASAIDRRLAYALHRLAFEGQILLTDAFAGAWPSETVQTLRAVQEAVDRILSGEDIRYYPPSA